MKSFSLVLLGALLAAISDAIQINPEQPFKEPFESGMKLPIFKLPDIKESYEKEETPILDDTATLTDETPVAAQEKVGSSHQETQAITDQTTQEKVGPGHIQNLPNEVDDEADDWGLEEGIEELDDDMSEG